MQGAEPYKDNQRNRERTDRQIHIDRETDTEKQSRNDRDINSDR